MSSPMNIWLINHYAGNLDVGMEYRHFFLARHLERRGHRVAIITSSFHHLYTTLPRVDGPVTFSESDKVSFAWIRTPSYNGNGPRRLLNMLLFSWRVERFRGRLEERFGRPDVVLASSPHPFVTLNLLRLKRAYGVPAFFEVRDLWPQMLIELGSIHPHHPLSYLFRWMEGMGYRRADRVISLWHSADRYMLEHGLSKDRYRYLPNGIEISDLAAEAEMEADHPLIRWVRERKAAGKFLVGYGGSHGFANPLECIVDACAILRDSGIGDVEFFMVGDGPVKREIVDRAERLELENLHFHDYVSRSTILAFYREVDVTFMGLRDLPLFAYGPTPNKLMDYLVVGKPVVFAIRSSFNPVHDAGAGVTVEPDAPEMLVGAIEELRSLPPEERERMGRAGHEYATRNLDFAELAVRLEGEMRECLAEAR